MRLQIVPRSEVEHTIKATTQPELGLQPKHNTHQHKLEEIEAILPNHTHIPPKAQPWILFDPFIHLVAESQALDRTSVHTITLPRRFLTMVEQYGTSGILLQSLSASVLEDLEETFPSATDKDQPIDGLFADGAVGRSQRFFARISTCSLKDSVYKPYDGGAGAVDRGSGPVKCVEQLWQRIATSGRALTGIQDLRAADLPVKLFLLPWNDEIQAQREYRVFCAPPSGEITAVSQYAWFKPWVHFDSGDAGVLNMEEKAQKILNGIIIVHQNIMAQPEIARSGMANTGFTFDVVECPDGRIAFLELNNFGAMSSCGSCLYHWIDHAEILYAAMESDIEFRVLSLS